eukprot:GHVS01070050.1.p1 GENE.GHVS01070050.1~~GHVS01070050.1.p1  ORF type:complete len:318 (-),score=29.53 GHVS01070050.1:132-1085(-)
MVVCGCVQPSSDAYTQRKPMHLTIPPLPLLLLQKCTREFQRTAFEVEAKIRGENWDVQIECWYSRTPLPHPNNMVAYVILGVRNGTTATVTLSSGDSQVTLPVVDPVTSLQETNTEPVSNIVNDIRDALRVVAERWHYASLSLLSCVYPSTNFFVWKGTVGAQAPPTANGVEAEPVKFTVGYKTNSKSHQAERPLELAQDTVYVVYYDGFRWQTVSRPTDEFREFLTVDPQKEDFLSAHRLRLWLDGEAIVGRRRHASLPLSACSVRTPLPDNAKDNMPGEPNQNNVDEWSKKIAIDGLGRVPKGETTGASPNDEHR